MVSHAARRHVAAVIVTAGLAALAACSSVSPTPTSGGSPPASRASSSASAVAYSACMRVHGVPNFPDPDAGTGGAVPKGDAHRFGVSNAALRAAQQGCQSLLPADGSLDQQAERC